MLKKKELKLSKEKPGREKIKSKPFFQPGRGRFNIYITFNSTAEVSQGEGGA